MLLAARHLPGGYFSLHNHSLSHHPTLYDPPRSTMIILDSETQKPPLATRAPSVVSNVESVSSASSDLNPPSYRSRHSRHSVQPTYDARPPSISDVDAPVKVKRRLGLEQGWCWKGLLYILAVYAVVSIAVAVPYFVTHHKNSSAPTTSYNRMDNDSVNTKSTVLAPPNIPSADGVVISCNQWAVTYAYGYPDPTESSRLTFSIPSNASNLWLHSSGKVPGLTSGQLSVIINPDETQTQYLISVTVTYNENNWNSRNSTAVCLMQSDQTSWGIGFYPSTSKSWNLNLQYQITIFMPNIDGDTYTLSQFSVNLPGFSLSFQDLQDYVVFDNVGISGESTSVDGVLSANVINITTSQASITGNYTSSESLILQTSSAAIDTNITLISGTEDTPTNLSIQSTEGFISARITLSGPLNLNAASLIASDSPSFQTNIIGEDTPVTVILNHTDGLLSSDLNLNVNTTFNRALVLLDEKFQGSFALRSVNGSILVADVDATTNFNDSALDGSFPTSTYYRRSLDIRSHSPSELHGSVRRDDNSQGLVEDTAGRINVQVQNYLALVAFGFFQSGDSNIAIAELGLRL